MADQRYQVLARKWRPQRFEDVVGQEHITRTLKNAIASGRIHHAFLFIGSRGIGKTTTARILAKALNCLSSDGPTIEPCGTCSNCTSIANGSNIDVIEIDGASNNSVDDVREIRDNVRMVPTNGRYKVYIIDEVHQLSVSAFNALLKTLEEPPPHAIFILATTEAQKIMATIISRCQRYDFRRVAMPDIVRLLRKILDHDGVKASDDALRAIARAAEGGVRDAESILDELITYATDGDEISFKDVFDVLGLVDWDILHQLCEAILTQDVARELILVEDVVAAGKDLSQFVQDILRYFRNLLVVRSAGNADLLQLPEEEAAEIMVRSQRFSVAQLIRLVEQFAELTSGFDSQLAQRIALEALLIKVSKVSTEASIDAILEKLMLLEQQGLPMAGPSPAASPAAAPAARPAPAAKPAPVRNEPPPDPPEAGPTVAAPTVPAEERRATITPEGLPKLWARLRSVMSEANLNLGIWLAEGALGDITGDAIVVHYRAKSRFAFEKMSQPDRRAPIEAWLAANTANLRRVQVVLEAEPAPSEDATDPNGAPRNAKRNTSDLVSPDVARALMEDPRLAHVAETFKARIIEVRTPAVAAPPEVAEPAD
jgi:DNA polymerase-3 subunit gamma/tau